MLDLPDKHDPNNVSLYVTENQWDGCELYGHIEGEPWDKILKAWDYPNPDHFKLEPHHIFGGAHRWDITSNLVAVCRPSHDWAHKNRQSATVLAIWVKLNKGEFDRELMRRCMGFDPIGAIEGYDLQEDWVIDIRMDVFERVSTGGWG